MSKFTYLLVIVKKLELVAFVKFLLITVSVLLISCSEQQPKKVLEFDKDKGNKMNNYEVITASSNLSSNAVKNAYAIAMERINTLLRNNENLKYSIEVLDVKKQGNEFYASVSYNYYHRITEFYSGSATEIDSSLNDALAKINSKINILKNGDDQRGIAPKIITDIDKNVQSIVYQNNSFKTVIKLEYNVEEL